MNVAGLAASRPFLQLEGAPQSLRVGLIVHGGKLPAYAEAIIHDVRASNFAQLAAVIDVEEQAADPSPLERHSDGRAGFGPHRLYAKFLDALGGSVDDATAMRSVLTWTQERPANGIHVLAIPASTLDSTPQVAALNLDVLIAFSAAPAARALRSAARFGVWILRIELEPDRSLHEHLLTKVLREDEVVRVRLDALSDSASHDVRLRCADPPVAFSLSIAEVRSTALWSSTYLIAAALRQLASDPTSFYVQPAAASVSHSSQRMGLLSSTTGVICAASRRAATKLIRRDAMTHWRIGLRRISHQPLYRDASAAALHEFHWLDAPRGHFWADPCLIRVDGETWLFFEALDRAVGRGTVACGRIDDNGALVDVKTILDEPFHLSFPFVFASGGEIFMLPERAESGTIGLYRAERFPYQWKHELDLLNLPGLDTVLIEHESHWWMWTTPVSVPDAFATTLLFVADRLTGPWRLHPSSPVCADARNARCAGGIIRDGKQLIRPSQNCTRTYGRKLNFSRISALTTADYREETFETVAAWTAEQIGVHSYAVCEGWEALDGKFILPRARVV